MPILGELARRSLQRSEPDTAVNFLRKVTTRLAAVTNIICMIRDRPLTWLFLLASIVVDLAMFFGGQGPVFEGILVGQVAAVAIWAAIGCSHRLTRGSLLVVAVGVLATLAGYRNLAAYSRALTFMAAYALVVVLTSLVVVWLRTQVRIRFDGDRKKAPLKVPLIEFFGWTIVVAIASFGARTMNVDILEGVLRFFPVYLLTYAIAPLALVLFDSRFRMLHLVKAVLFIGGVYLIAAFFLDGFKARFVVVTSVAAYLTTWLLVRSIEYDQLKKSAEDSEEDTNEQNGESIKLFDVDQ